MVQAISLDSLIKDVTPAKNVKEIDSNVDFLELLLKDMDSDNLSKDDKDFIKKLDSKKDEDILDDKKLDLDSKFDLKLEPKLQFSKQNIEEIKNIITSKFNQENIILSKQDIKEFKNIDNLKDLMSFADKKGLNIEKLKVDIQTEVTPELKESIEKFFDEKPKIPSTKDTILKKQSLTDNKANQKTSLDDKKTISLENIIHKDEIKKDVEIKKETHKEKKQKVSLEKLLNKTDKKSVSDKKSINKVNTEVKTAIKQPQENIKKEKPIKNESLNNVNKEIITKQVDKVNLESLITKKDLKEKHIDKSDKNVKIDSLESLLNPKDKIETKKVQPKDSLDININQQNMVNEIKAKSVQAKETINHFKNNLDEAIKNYKPPISKVDIELNPKNLGKVEVSIIQRGNNIHINMNTDQSNVMLFQTHQAEFRQALASIGFSNIDMSFNSNQDRDRRQNQAKKTYKENENIENIGEIEIKADYKYA